MLTSVLEIMNWLFWQSVWQVEQLVKSIFVAIIPQSLIMAEAIKRFEEVGIKTSFAGDPGIGKYDKKKYSCEIVVHNVHFFRAIAFDDSLSLGETYMDRWYDCDNVAEYINRLLKIPVSVPQLLANRVALATNQQTIGALSLRVVEEHYNLGNDLYSNMLDRTMNYTCGLWYPETKTLEESQINKMDIIGRKLKLKPGMTVMDIGCGFGGAAKYLATKFGVSVTAYNISVEQVAYARESCKGLDITIIEEDYRNATGQFDAIYSIGFFEAVGSKNFRGYFEVVNRCLKPDGLTLLHTITTDDRQTRTDRWLNKYIFPGGELPYVSDLVQAPSGIFVVEDLQSFGKSYAKTLNCWRMNFCKNWENIEKKYKGQMNGKFYRMFEFYLAFCEGCFLDRSIQLHQAVYSKYPREAEYYSVRDKRE